MKKFLSVFFIVLGVIFFAVLVFAGVYFYLSSSSGSKPSIFNGTSGGSIDKNPFLSESQEKALEQFGIDPADVPSKITPEQEACFKSKLGEARVEEIKAGSAPTVMEYFRAKDCI